MRYGVAILVPAVLLLSSCNDAGRDTPAAARGTATVAASAECPADGDRLPITGICASRAADYLNTPGGTPPEAPRGCGWIVQETRFGDDVLLYRALQCGGKATRLAYSEGAGMADLAYDTAAYGDAGNALKGEVLVRVTGSDDSNRTANLLRIARDAIDDPQEGQGCMVRNAGVDFWPRDALVVDVGEAQAAKASPDGPRTACGPFGLSEDESSFWRVFQGHSWFFQLGQDLWQVDPGSFTLLSKGSDGRWSQVK
ncbi:hypothetical protein [Citromicrobium bathyomarinum]|uniref:hypothetical protein n=1 Tax=Citromicrobium bathyomarinum TaxID=72174 RepID=UPI00315AA517